MREEGNCKNQGQGLCVDGKERVMFGTDDITFCTADCAMKDSCYRNPALIKEPQYPHSFADFSKNCMAYEPQTEREGE